MKMVTITLVNGEKYDCKHDEWIHDKNHLAFNANYPYEWGKDKDKLLTLVNPAHVMIIEVREIEE